MANMKPSVELVGRAISLLVSTSPPRPRLPTPPAPTIAPAVLCAAQQTPAGSPGLARSPFPLEVISSPGARPR